MNDKDKTKNRPAGDDKSSKKTDKSKVPNSAGGGKPGTKTQNASVTKSNTGAVGHQKASTSDTASKTGAVSHQESQDDGKLDIVIQKLAEIHSQVNKNQKAISDKQAMMDEIVNHPDGDDSYYDNETYDSDREYDDEECDSSYEPPPKKKRDNKSDTRAYDTETDKGNANDNVDENEKQSAYQVALAKYKKSQEKVDKPINSDIADLVNERFKHGVDREHYKTLVEGDSMQRPGNCPSLTEVRVNESFGLSYLLKHEQWMTNSSSFRQAWLKLVLQWLKCWT